MEAERLEKEQKENQQIVLYENTKSQKQLVKKINPTVYPTHMIPDASQKSLHTKSSKQDEFRPNNFMYGIQKSTIHADEEDEPLEIDLTEDEYNYAVRMTEHSLRRLTKSHIF